MKRMIIGFLLLLIASVTIHVFFISQPQNSSCENCIGFSDNGRTITLTGTSIIAIELPTNLYSKDSVTIIPSDSAYEVNSKITGDTWIRTFQLTSNSSSTIKIPALDNTDPYIVYILRKN